jgi:hypothetical protein
VKVLVACEFSGKVREAFKKKGHDAWSCDLRPTEIEGQHYQCDVRELFSKGWDLMIAHPPCTHIAVSGAAWFKQKIADGRQQQGIDFFMDMVNAPIPKIAVENPISIMSSRYRKPDQIVHPWMFGQEFSKPTCLWLKNLPCLKPTNVVGKGEFKTSKSGRRGAAWNWWLPPGPEREKIRSTTFQGSPMPWRNNGDDPLPSTPPERGTI